MLVVSELDDVFVPLRGGLFVRPKESQYVVKNTPSVFPIHFALEALSPICWRVSGSPKGVFSNLKPR